MKKYLLMYGRFSNEYIFADFDCIKERAAFSEKIENNTNYCYCNNVQYSRLSKDLKAICDRQLEK